MVYFDNTPLFRDRATAGRALAERLASYADRDAVVLGIPRGGVPVAAKIARRLNADLDIITARKIGAPTQPELAVGAVTADGTVLLNDDIVGYLRLDEAWITQAAAAERLKAQQREERLRGGRRPASLLGRVVILVDDGLATGATMRAAVRAVRNQAPKRVVVAVPVGSRQACAMLSSAADEVLCLYTPATFWAVGLYYEHFEPTRDEEVQQLLAQAHARRRGEERPSPPPA